MRLIPRTSALLLLVLGCPSEPMGPRMYGAGDDTPRSGGTFVFHHESGVDTMDPHLAFNELSTIALRLLYDGLLDYDAEGELVPSLAVSMPTISEGGTRFRFRLRRGVQFHPLPGAPEGRELTAHDVVYSLHRMMSQELGSPGFPFFKALRGADEYHQGNAESVEGIVLVDRYTIDFRLTEPDQTFLNAMAMTFAYPIARESVGRWGTEVGRHPAGVGPMIFDGWERGVQIEFRRHPHYWKQDAHPDRMVYVETLMRGTAVMRFRNGDLDAIHRQSTQDYLFFKRAEAWQPYMNEHPSGSTWGIIMNTGLAPFDNVHVRRAVAYGVDSESWARARSGRISATGQLVPPNIWGYAENLESEHHLDRERARAELREAGYPNGLPEPIQLAVGEGDVSRIYGELFQSDMAEIGITVELRPLSFPTLIAESSKPRTMQTMLWGWSLDFPDAASFFDPNFHTAAIHPEHSQNRAFYSNPEFDALLDSARAETDREQRRSLYRQAADTLNRDAPWAFVFNPTVLEVWQPYVRGYRPHPVWSEDYRQVWLDLPKQRNRPSRSPTAALDLLPGRRFEGGRR